jgi:plasmid stabilization system protein ParE
MSELIWLPEALLDLSEHFEFLKLKNPDAAGRVAQSIRDVGFSLAQNPYEHKRGRCHQAADTRLLWRCLS